MSPLLLALAASGLGVGCGSRRALPEPVFPGEPLDIRVGEATVGPGGGDDGGEDGGAARLRVPVTIRATVPLTIEAVAWSVDAPPTRADGTTAPGLALVAGEVGEVWLEAQVAPLDGASPLVETADVQGTVQVRLEPGTPVRQVFTATVPLRATSSDGSQPSGVAPAPPEQP